MDKILFYIKRKWLFLLIVLILLIANFYVWKDILFKENPKKSEQIRGLDRQQKVFKLYMSHLRCSEMVVEDVRLL